MNKEGYYIAHRINSLSELAEIPTDVGVEIDIRYNNKTGSLYLNHDNGTGEDLSRYLKDYKLHPERILIFNIKDTGTESECIKLAAEFNIPKSNYFLLDCEFPYIYQATKSGIREIALRFSEAEVLEQALLFAPNNTNPDESIYKAPGVVDWLWIDTNSTLPLNSNIMHKINEAGFKTCLVCPERWGRADDIERYAKIMKDDSIYINAVMTNKKYIQRWRDTGVVRRM